MLITIVLIYCLARYGQQLAPDNAKAIALVALILTLLAAIGWIILPGVPPAGR